MKLPLEITPATKVGDLLAERPELEEVLVRQAPAFANLRNPILRRTVAKVATLEMAARVGGIPVRDLVTTLRRAAGLEPACGAGSPESVPEETPGWLDPARVRATVDAEALLAAGEVPLGPAVQAAAALAPGEILLVTGTFEPAPLVELLRQKGYGVHVRRAGPERFETYVRACR